MPYIAQSSRVDFLDCLESLPTMKTKGELEFVLFKILTIYMEDREKNYTNLHETTYACQHVSDEFRRRYLDKREDEAINLNGDI